MSTRAPALALVGGLVTVVLVSLTVALAVSPGADGCGSIVDPVELGSSSRDFTCRAARDARFTAVVGWGLAGAVAAATMAIAAWPASSRRRPRVPAPGPMWLPDPAATGSFRW